MKHGLKIFIVILVLITSILLFIPQGLYAEIMQFWVDTSHWETTSEWVEEGHYSTISDKRWIDTSYWVTQGYWDNYTETIWVDTSHWASIGACSENPGSGLQIAIFKQIKSRSNS